MSKSRFNIFLKAKHLSEFSAETIVNSFGIYEYALIDMRGVIVTEGEQPRVEASEDIKALHKCFFNNNPIMLPCHMCMRDIPFIPVDRFNPSDRKNVIPRIVKFPILHGFDESVLLGGLFSVPRVEYSFGNDILVTLQPKDIEVIEQQDAKEQFWEKCVFDCKRALLAYYNEIRRDYMCSYDNTHSLFVHFRIFHPIEAEDVEEYNKQRVNGDNDFTRAYDLLKDCLIIQKVGQYPSLADMQLFDVAKYRSLLGNESYRDLTRAIGLRADGIGAGAFLYLRRIFERLVEEIHKEECKKDTWIEEEYIKLHFDQRIKLLEERGNVIIPEELSNVRTKIYSVLSKGVHESSDNECMELFPYIIFAIEQILDERIRDKERKDKLRKLEEEFNKSLE